MPRPALERFVEWAGGPSGHYLLVAFSSVHADEIAAKMRQHLAAVAVAPERLEISPRLEEMAADPVDPEAEWPAGTYLERLRAEAKAKFLGQIETATAIYFGGGDQNKHMAVLADSEIRTALHRKLEAGTPFGGGSAGLHVLSHPMIAGDAPNVSQDPYAVLTAVGLGALNGIIADSHFLERRRTTRLKGALRRFPEVGVGIGVDQDSAIVVENGIATAMGRAPVELYVKSRWRPDDFWNVTLASGAQFDLQRRRRVGAREGE